ncbi:MAG: Mov34/MPN/PAD-1 family protein [Candidatus Helarchaeota archaeon]
MFESIQGITITKDFLEEMIHFAKQNHPTEAAMLLFGKIDGEWAVIEVIEPTENINNSPVTFEIDPEEFYRIYVKNEKMGREFVGIFHSHPAPSFPSQIDIPNMKTTQVIWLILGISDPNDDFISKNINAFIWRNESVQKLRIKFHDKISK